MTPPTWLAGIRERAERASPGPWFWNNGSLLANHGHRPAVLAASSHNRTPYISECSPEGLLQRLNPLGPNALLIAAARTDVPRLVQAVEILSEALSAMFIIKDGIPHYNTHNGIAQRMPTRIERTVKRMLAQVEELGK